MMKSKNLNRRHFLGAAGTLTVGALLTNPVQSMARPASSKTKLALVGTGVRGTSFWGKNIVDNYSNEAEFVGLCDINLGRLQFALDYMGVDCPVFTDFEEMVNKTKPEIVIVTTMDSTHDKYIVKALEMGCDVITEKPMTTDEVKCQSILDAERKTGRKVIVGFNYRYGHQFSKLKELLTKKEVGKITSVDFHWYLNTYHGASYFRRWHGERDKGGTLLVHKSTHHFDLLNWWIDSDPLEVTAYGELEHYGNNNEFRGANCRSCAYTDKCKFYWDIMENDRYVNLYVKNEKYDGYIRDNCLWRHDVDIYDKMAVQIKYANDVQVSYSLTTYSPYEGWRIAFNGMDGRIDSWEGIPWRADERVNQAQLHAQEMNQNAEENSSAYDEIMVMKNWESEYDLVKVPRIRGGHGGGDVRLQDKIFKDPNMADPYKHSAGTRDGAMSILIGIAARKSIEEQRPVKISELTDIPISSNRG
ncbi:Gfo/Idh/MocA family oxidoreductase [uncultured Sunxiuqinia sp.]|uniref:Gfo/Idh/MocA family protein n=1 Tax=uncultured Sunxiuqinia sp. TaxID=1573825 RepID=UPI002AA82DBC|nr:Gfo/Idh/MocA family oxidoreductase [uncultured Sunxiuqinia sp.]